MRFSRPAQLDDNRREAREDLREESNAYDACGLLARSPPGVTRQSIHMQKRTTFGKMVLLGVGCGVVSGGFRIGNADRIIENAIVSLTKRSGDNGFV